MATKKISELEAISEAASDDVLAIVDVSETETRKITKGNLLVGAGHTIEMSLNSTTYTLTLSLKNEAGTVLNTQTVDLPNENAITGITYSDGALTLTKQSGVTSSVSISGLISGLVNETTFNDFVTSIKATIGISTNTYNSSSTYNTGDIVVQNEKIYKCKQDNVTGTFDNTKWDEISLYQYEKIQDEKIEGKVDKEVGKGLSTKDFTAAYETKLIGIETGAEVNTIEIVKVNGTALTPTNKEVDVPVPTNTSDLNNDSGFGTYSKPSGGIPKTDLSSDVQTSLGKADSALQEHQDISGKVDKEHKTGSQVEYKVLSDNNYTDAEKEKLASLENYDDTDITARVDDIEEEQETQNEDIEKLQDKVANQQKILSQMPKVTGEGTEFTMENTIEAQFAEFLPEGNTEQETTTGVQLFDGIVEEGSLSSGQNATSSTSLIRSKNYSVVKPNTQHAFSVNGTLNKVVMNYYDTNKNWIDIGAASGELCDTGIFTTPENAHYVRFRCYAADYNLFSTGKIQIEEGSTAHLWEKYTGGQPAPNIDYPQDRYSAGGNGSITEKIVNKNWFDKNNATIFNAYINTSNKKIETNNNARCLVIPCRKNTTYTVSRIAGQRFVVGVADSYSIDTICSEIVYNFTATSLTITNTDNKYLIVYYYISTADTLTEQKILDSIQIEFGSTATPYTEHKEQTYTMPVQQEMRSIGTVRDGFVKKNGVWYERHNIARYEFTGQENWTLNRNVGTCNQFRTPTGFLNVLIQSQSIWADSNQQAFSHFIVGNVNNVDKKIATVTGNGEVAINYDVATANEFKAVLAAKYTNNTPVYVDYISAEPTDLPCTQAQIDVLEDLPETYAEQTNVLSEDSVPAYVKASGYLDLNTLVARVAQLETEV